jgi:hypothetical protein
MATFAEAWNQAWLDVPAAGALQVRQWAQNAYKRLFDARAWSWRIRRSAFLLQDARDLAVGVTEGSATVTSVGLFVAGDQGRQFRVGTYPVYNIVTYTDANTILLDRPYEGETLALVAEGEILSAYVTAPADLEAIQIVVDLTNQVRIGHWYTQEALSLLDPTRTNAYSGPVRGLFSSALTPSGGTITPGLLQWEAWPYTTSRASLPYSYLTKAFDLADSDNLPGILRERPDVLALGAKYEAAMWPGTPSQKNPYFNLTLAEMLGKQVGDLLTQMAIRDDDQYFQDYTAVSWAQFPLANLAPTADYLRHTDSPAWAAYNGGLY